MKFSLFVVSTQNLISAAHFSSSAFAISPAGAYDTLFDSNSRHCRLLSVGRETYIQAPVSRSRPARFSPRASHEVVERECTLKPWPTKISSLPWTASTWKRKGACAVAKLGALLVLKLSSCRESVPLVRQCRRARTTLCEV